jgi:predicted RNA-binding Zn ribbon-like protein
MSNGVRVESELLLELLNSSPIVDGTPTDELRGAGADAWLRARDLPGTAKSARELRDAIAAVIRGQQSASTLQHYLDSVRQVPLVGDDGVQWRTTGGGIAARMVLAWSDHRDRIRPCENDAECTLFLIDRSKANSRRWCSMTTCGNRLKARRHHQRTTASR